MEARTFITAMVVALAGGLGCNSEPSVYDVTGTVSCDGRLIDEGEIVFIAVDNSSTPGASKIQNGRYHVKMLAGMKKVKIAASRKIPGKGAMGEDFVYQSYVPPRYNDQTTLEAEVKPGAANQFDFQLDSKPSP